MHLSNNQMLLEALDEYVVGHYEAKKALISMLTRSKVRWYQKYMQETHEDYLVDPMKILLIGASGTGKTHLVDSLQKITHFPLIKLDATELNPTGASGGIKANKLKDMIVQEAQACCMSMPYLYSSIEGAVDRTVVFIDEIDKLGASFDSSGNWNKHVQSNFLTLIDNKDEYKGVSYVFAGAFNDITGVKAQNKGIGFQHNNTGPDKAADLIDERVVKSGLLPEFVGRINCIVELDVFDFEQMLSILKERLIPKKMLDLAAFHVFDVEIPQEELNLMVGGAIKSGQGVRFLARALDRYCLEHEFRADFSQLYIGDVPFPPEGGI